MSWITPAELGIILDKTQLVSLITQLPKRALVESVCQLLSLRDLVREDLYAGESDFVSTELARQVSDLRGRTRSLRTLFHFRQLLLLLALAIKYADPHKRRQLSESERRQIGGICLQITGALSDVDGAGDELSLTPIASRSKASLALARDAMMSMPPAAGFLAVFRAFRVLIVHLRNAAAEQGLGREHLFECFHAFYGVSLEKAWSLLALFCQTRYPVADLSPRACHFDMTALDRLFDWTATEVNGAKRLLALQLEELAEQLPTEPLADLPKTFDVLIGVPVVEIRKGLWWAFGPFLVGSALRLMYSAMRACLKTTEQGRFDSVFGRAVELYVLELIGLARASGAPPGTLALTLCTRQKGWPAKRPEFEVGEGSVRQLVEVKAKYFNPGRVFGNGWFRGLEKDVLSHDKGVGQLACYAVARYAGIIGQPPTRIQSILVLTERTPTLIPGIQSETSAQYSNAINHHNTPQVDIGSLHRQVQLLSLEDFEQVIAMTTVGQELKDVLDALRSRQEGTYQSATQILPEIWEGLQGATHDWLGEPFDQLFALYKETLGQAADKATTGENVTALGGSERQSV